MRTPFTLTALLLLAAPLLGQQYYYNPSDTPGVGTCNVIPFGTTKPDPNWENQRYQAAFSDAQLGNPTNPLIICSLAFAPCGVQKRSFDSLKITMAQSPLPLGADFNNNLAVRPTVVFDGSCRIWPTKPDAWSDIGLQRSFIYIPGQGDLVVEIIAIGNHLIGTGGTGFHRDGTSTGRISPSARNRSKGGPRWLRGCSPCSSTTGTGPPVVPVEFRNG
jgi:hypothetical protein